MAGVVEEIFRIKSDTAQVLKQIQDLKGVFVELTEEQKKQVQELTILEQKEKALLKARTQSSNPTTLIRINKEYNETIKKLGALKESVDSFTKSEIKAKEEANLLSQAVSNAFKQTQVAGAGKAIDELAAKASGATRSGFNPLNNTVNQLTRELPAFAVSANVGFLAISNNLPIFFDALQRINKENAELAKGGKATTPVLKQLGEAVFSVGTLLSVGVTLLTLYGGAIAKTISSLFGQKEAFELNTESLKILNDEIEASQKNQDKFTERITANALEIIKYSSGLGKLQVDNLTTLSKFQDEFEAIEKRRKKAVAEAVVAELQAGNEKMKISQTVKDGMIQIKNEENGELIKLDLDAKNVIADKGFFGKESLSRTEKALRDKLAIINRENKIELQNLELLLKEEERKNALAEKDRLSKVKAHKKARLKEEIDLRDKIRQLYIDDTKNEEQRAIEQVRFDNERAKREIEKLQVDENLKGEARIAAIKRLEAQKAELQIALDKDLFNREEAIRVKYQKETDDKIKADFEKTIKARADILNEDMDFELYLLEEKYKKEKQLGIEASDAELKRLQKMILAKKIAILQEKADQEEVGKNATEKRAIENKLAHDIEKLRKESNERITEDEKKNHEERMKAYINYFEQIVNAAIDATQKIIDVKIKEVDALISQQQRRVDAVKNIADKGNAELLQLEQERLDELTKKKEKYVRDQQSLAAVELIANTAIAVSKAAAQGGVAAGVTIAAALIALVAGLASARAIAGQAAFYDGGLYDEKGGYTGDGNPTHESKAFRKPYIHHKQEVIISHKPTRKFKDILLDVNDGKIDLNEWKKKVNIYDAVFSGKQPFNLNNQYMSNPQVTNIIQFKQMEAKMDEMNRTLGALKLGLNVDEDGFTTFMQKRIDRKNFIKNLAK